jgi:hypothetical protein
MIAATMVNIAAKQAPGRFSMSWLDGAFSEDPGKFE